MAKEKLQLDKETRDEIERKALQQIQHCRIAKQGKITNWQKNESMYYDIQKPVTETRANVNLGRMQEFVHTLQSKINKQKVFKFTKRKEAQIRRVERLNALRDADRNTGHWNMKMLVGGKQLLMYGREVYSYYADAIDKKYKSHFGNVDVYDFLIDPKSGGIDMDRARFLGDYGVIYQRHELEDGIESGLFLENETRELLENSSATGTESNQEENNKRNRTSAQNTIRNIELNDEDEFKFWRWFTTYKGERYYLLLQEKTGGLIRIEKLTDIMSPTEEVPLGMWPYWSNAAFPDMTEFWTPSYCDYVREIFMAQEVSIDQMLDNSEAVNKPMKVVNTSAIEDLAKLKYRRDRIIPTKGNFDANRAVQILQTPPIQGPILVFDKLEQIQEKSSGVNATAKGTAGQRGDEKATIYLGNKQETDGRFDLLDFSRSHGMNRFARLYEIGVRDNLTKKKAVDILGPQGIETEEISRKDIFRKGDEFLVMIEDTEAEANMNVQLNAIKINFINGELSNPAMKGQVNPRKAFEIKAKIAGMTDEEIKELTDVSEFGNQALMAEAARDIERLLDDEDLEPNEAANNAYKQKFVDFMRDQKENMDMDQFARFVAYVKSLDEVIAANEARAVNTYAINQLQAGMGPAEAPGNGPGVEALMPQINPVEEPQNVQAQV